MMKIYKVTALGGMEGRDHKTYYYNTLENAYNHIRKETWEDVLDLYEVKVVANENGQLLTAHNGQLTAIEEVLARPKTAREIAINRVRENTTYID